MTSKKGQALKDAVLEEMSRKPGPKKRKKGQHPNSLKALAESRKPFKPNDPKTGEKDPRINRKGAPDTTAAMRTLIRQIGADLVHLSEEGATGSKRTKIVSRMTRKIIEMYGSSNPADNATLLKAAYPGILAEDTNKKVPTQFTFKIVYENKRPVPGEDVLEGEELEPGVGELEAGQQDHDADLGGEDRVGGRVGGAPFVGGDAPDARWGLDILQQDLDGQEEEQPGQDKPGYGLRYHPEEFYCVVCKDKRTGPALPSIPHGGWICEEHKDG